MDTIMYTLRNTQPYSPLTARPLRKRRPLAAALLPTALALASLALPVATKGATVWTGPPTTFTKAAGADPTLPANQDRITPNVWITRAGTTGIYNAKSETSFTHAVSPAGTEWANGTITNYASLTYQSWEPWTGGAGGGPPSTVGRAAVLHLISEDIYMDIKFTSWGSGAFGGGAFAYQRSTPTPANVPPSVTITNPPDNASFSSPALVTIEAAANDTDGSVTNVEFFDGVVSLGSDSTSPYSVSASLAPGSHTLTALASDNLGATTTSAPIHVTVANQAPTVAITYPPDGTAMSTPANVTVTANAADLDGSVASVQFFDGATALGTDTTSPYSVTVNFSPGVHPLTAVATDNLGFSTTSAVVSFTVTAPNQPPSVTITNPVENATFGNTDTVTIGASASDTDGSVTNVQFFDGLVSLGNRSTSPYSVSTRLALGLHTLTVVAADNLGAKTTSAPVHLTVARYLPAIPNGNIAIHLQSIATGLAAPDYAISPPGDASRLFVVEQNGLLRIIQNGTLLPGAALDIQSRVQPPLVATNANDERGFLGLAFHPGFNNPASPGYRTLYTYNSELIPAATTPTYPAPNGAAQGYKNVVNEWKISTADANVVDPASRREVISFGKNANNHNGGTITFGPDGYAYIALGDGGNANDVGASHIEPGGNAQNLSTPLGKMLRFDPLNPALTTGSSDPISANGQYRVPTTNPFQLAGQVPEIYAYGLRNPYRFSFDRVTGDLIEGDVGQNNIEEINRIVLGGNYGWAIKEGDFLFNRTNGPSGNAGTIGAPPGNRSLGIPAGLTDPITGTLATLEYDHNEGISITGGFVYRGTAIPELFGKYIFGDLALKTAPVRADGRIFYADLQTGLIKAFPWPQFGGSAILPNGLTVHGFGQDADGELYALVTSTPASGTGGIVYKLVAAPAPLTEASLTYVERKLISDIPGLAEQTDPNLRNPWGIAFSPTSPFWIADNHAGVSTLYNISGLPLSLVVAIPSPAGGTSLGTPTGVVYNNTPDFLVGPALPARFIFATEDGTIAGWNNGANAVLKADNSASGAIYKGLALGSSGGSSYLYAANFHAGQVDVFDASYNRVTLAGSFSDPTLPAGFAPFNIQNVGGQLFVAYALQDALGHDDVSGPGNGFVNVFDTSGHLLKRFASNDVLNSPWGIVLAPAGFGGFSQALLIGNFGDGRINAFDPATGQHLGMLQNASGTPLAIQGLWDLKFGNGGQGGDSHTLYFTAGIAGGANLEDHGLFGSISAIVPTITSIADKGLAATINWAGGVAPFLLQKKLSLSDATWWNVLTTSNRSVTVAKEGASGFFRILNQAQTKVLPFTVLLNGAAEIPVVTTPATALGTISIESNLFTYHISFSGLSAAATAAHVHGPASATNSAGVLFPLIGASGTNGTLFGTHTLTLAELQAITNGLAYVNIHTAPHPGGEIRGQIVPLQLKVTLNGASEVPAVATTGTGTLTMIGNQLSYVVSYSGLAGTATASHIHGPADVAHLAGVLVPLNTPTGTSGTISGTLSLTPQVLADVLAGMTYINIHSTANPGGEIRGQILR